MESTAVVRYRARMRCLVLSVLNTLVFVCSACGSVASTADATEAPETDALLPDAPQPDGARRRCDPTQPFLNPTLVPNVNSASSDVSPRLSADELEMVFASQRPGGVGGYDLYLAGRPSLDVDFGTPEAITELNTSESDNAPFLANDNLTLFYSDRRTLNVLVAMRPSRTARFGIGSPVVGINSSQDDSEPYLAQGEQVVYFPSNRSNVSYDIYRATRDNDGEFRAPMPIVEINTDTFSETSPVTAADGLTIYWSRVVDGATEIWSATRPSTSAAFSALTRHGTLNTTPSAFDVPSWISVDNCVIYIFSSRPGGLGGNDIWVAKRPM